jgi:hypothetical protein
MINDTVMIIDVTSNKLLFGELNLSNEGFLLLEKLGYNFIIWRKIFRNYKTIGGRNL